MTGLVFFAPWASARGVLLLRIFERKGVFWTILSETIRIAKRGARCPHCGQRCRPLQFATAPLRSCPNFGQLPMMSLSQFATSELKGVFQVATICRNWRRAGRPNFGRANPSVAVRISDFYHSSATVAELKGAALQASTTRFQPLCGWGGIFYRLEGKRACPGAGGATPDVLILWCTLSVSGNF